MCIGSCYKRIAAVSLFPLHNIFLLGFRLCAAEITSVVMRVQTVSVMEGVIVCDHQCPVGSIAGDLARGRGLNDIIRIYLLDLSPGRRLARELYMTTAYVIILFPDLD